METTTKIGLGLTAAGVGMAYLAKPKQGAKASDVELIEARIEKNAEVSATAYVNYWAALRRHLRAELGNVVDAPKGLADVPRITALIADQYRVWITDQEIAWRAAVIQAIELGIESIPDKIDFRSIAEYLRSLAGGPRDTVVMIDSLNKTIAAARNLSESNRSWLTALAQGIAGTEEVELFSHAMQVKTGIDTAYDFTLDTVPGGAEATRDYWDVMLDWSASLDELQMSVVSSQLYIELKLARPDVFDSAIDWTRDTMKRGATELGSALGSGAEFAVRELLVPLTVGVGIYALTRGGE